MSNRPYTKTLLLVCATLLTAAYSQALMVPIDAGILEAFAEHAKGLLVNASADVYQGQLMLTGSVKKTENRKKAQELRGPRIFDSTNGSLSENRC